MSQHRAEVRPRYGRIAVLGTSLATTAVALLGGIGVLPSAADGRDQAPRDQTSAAAAESPVAAPDNDNALTGPRGVTTTSPGVADGEAPSADDKTLPAASGDGRRIVFSQSRQRVWLVGGNHDQVLRTYLVSGSAEDNLDPGTYPVYSRSMDAIGIDDSGTMKYFVRFTRGDTGAAIGFHDIPIDEGDLVQTASQLGVPLSHGCIRQKRTDARALWQFAPLGTSVVVTA